MSTVKETARMAGLVSGLDTESLIKAATANTTNAINSRKQKLQKLQWKQDAYRDVISKIKEFQDKYLKIDAESSIRANAVMKSNKATSSNDKLSVSANSTAVTGDYTITAVKKATAAKLGGESVATRGVSLNFFNVEDGEQTVQVTLDGVTKDVTFNKDKDDPDASAQNFLSALNSSFANILKKDDAGHSSQFKMEAKNGKWQLSMENMASDKVSHIFTVNYNDAVGLESDAGNTISTQSTLGSVDFINSLDGSNYKFSINGVDFSFDKDTKIADMMSEINKSDAGVKITFSGLTQSFNMETLGTGAGQEIDLGQTEGNLLNALFNIDGNALGTAPTVAELGDKVVDNDKTFKITASPSGLADGDNIMINGVKLGISGLGKTQETGSATYKDKEYDNGLKFINDNGDVVTKILEQGTATKVYLDSNNEVLFKVEGGKVYDKNDALMDDKEENSYLAELGYSKKYAAVSEDDYEKALNDAYASAFGKDYPGSFSVNVYDDKAEITFDPGDQAATVAVTGKVSVDGIEEGKAQNFTVNAYDESHVIAKGDVGFIVNGGKTVVAEGTGTDGALTIGDLLKLTDDDGKALFKYDTATGKLSVTGTNVLQAVPDDGKGGMLNMEATVQISDLFGSLKLVGEDTRGSMVQSGQNGTITINGITLESSSNVFSIDGTTFGIENVKEFDENDIAAGKADEITVNVAKDNSKIKETITNFMEDYNKLLDTINAQLSTARPKDSSNKEYYEPLTEEQKEEMSDDEIEKWEEKAKTGMLYRDTTLTKVFNQLRSAINGNVGGFTIQALGIDTSDDYTEYGKLRFVENGESILDSAIERYGDELSAFFTDPENGLASRLNNAVNAAIDTNTDRRGYPNGSLVAMAGVKDTRSEKKNQIYSQIEAMQKVIERLNTRYETQYERLWKQYSSLETYMMNMSNQSSSLFNSTLFGMNNNSEG